MNETHLYSATGVIIPVWFPDNIPLADVEGMLVPCLADSSSLASAGRILLVLDGVPRLRDLAQRLQARLGAFTVVIGEQNQGKGGAVALGIERLLADPGVRFIVTRDHDNDHLANDAINLVRLAMHMQEQAGTEAVAVIGRRWSIHRHLGFARGEFETTMNEVIMDAVRYSTSCAGLALNTQFTAAYEPPPDLQSGFKCYSRLTAQRYLEALEQAKRLTPGLDVRRHGAEAPVLVNTWLAGGLVGEIQRASMEHQPFTTYDPATKLDVNGTVLVWTLERSGVPLPAARQFLLNAIARRLLTKDRQGAADLLALANWVMERLAGLRGESATPIATVAHSDYF